MTKIQLLKTVSETDIIKQYVSDFKENKKQNYHSPFADKDDKPSLSFYQKGSNWFFKSHNTGHQGDVFQFVADLKKIDCKKNFPGVIEVIERDMKLNGYASKIIDNKIEPVYTDKKKSIKISFEKTATTQMLSYFKKFKINIETLTRFNVNQVKYHEFISATGKLCKFDYRKLNQLAICYSVNEHIKIYFPEIEGKQDKSFGYKDQSSNDIFGLSQLQALNPKPSLLFISAGEKDCLALNANGFAAITFQSENHIPTKQQVTAIEACTKNVFVIYDNDTPGKQAAEKICKLNNKWKTISLPAGVKDAADFFKTNNKEAFQKLLDGSQIKKNEQKNNGDEDEENHYTIFHQAENYLLKNYDLRYNTIKLELEMSLKGANSYGQLNENDLFVEMNKRGVKVGMDKLIAILKSSFVTRYNPLVDYFNNLPPWDDNIDHIAHLTKHLHCDEHEQLLEQFTKWLVRCVRCVMDEGYYNKQALILVHSKQNSGKSTFCRFLCPPALKDYIAENISDDKDSRIALAKNFIINLDELASLAKHEINSLKTLFSKDIINERLPYDRKNSIIHRVASFVGSTNMAEFLTDETGSVRWLCFEIKNIDWNYKKAIDIDKVWGLAYQLYKEGYEADMTREDIEHNEKRNSKFQQLSSEAEVIPKFFAPAEEGKQDAIFMTATEILMHIASNTTIKLNKVMIGRAMPICGFRRVKDNETDRYGYWVRKAVLF